MFKRLVSFIDREAASTALPLRPLILVAVVTHVAMIFVAVNPWHPDEHFQILEFAWARYGLAPTSDLPWEFEAQIRQSLQPLLAMGLLGALRVVGLTSPYLWVFLLHLGTAVVALGTVLWVIANVSSEVSRAGKRTLWLTGYVLWFAPFLYFRFTSENVGGLALALAIPLVQRAGTRRSRDLVCGVLLGLSFLLRFQVAFAIAALFLWVVKERGVRGPLVRITASAIAVFAFGVLCDVWFYEGWVLTPWEYFRVNLLEGKAASFGTSPWYSYLVMLPTRMAPPLGYVLFGLAFATIVARPGSPWTWVGTAFFIGHSFVAHKELRFFFTLVYALPVYLAYSVDALSKRILPGRWHRGAIRLLAVQNVALLLILFTPAIHRGNTIDWHYLRFLWQSADAQLGEPLYVLAPPSEGLQVGVYRHPAVREVNYRAGDDVTDLLPPGTAASQVLVMTHDDGLPSLEGVRAYTPVYTFESGVLVMARWIGAEDWRWVRRLNASWRGMGEARTLYRIDLATRSAPGRVVPV